MTGVLIKTQHTIAEDMASSNYSIDTLDDINKLLK